MITTRRRERGFTLIEMMIVVVVIGILVGIAMVGLRSSQERAYYSAMKSDLKNIASAQVAYYNDQLGTGSPPRYARQVNDLDVTLSDGVQVRLRGNRRGWSARARHSALANQKQCAVYAGQVNPFNPASAEGVIACQ